jgi:hypothetical protein
MAFAIKTMKPLARNYLRGGYLINHQGIHRYLKGVK